MEPLQVHLVHLSVSLQLIKNILALH